MRKNSTSKPLPLLFFFLQDVVSEAVSRLHSLAESRSNASWPPERVADVLLAALPQASKNGSDASCAAVLVGGLARLSFSCEKGCRRSLLPASLSSFPFSHPLARALIAGGAAAEGAVAVAIGEALASENCSCEETSNLLLPLVAHFLLLPLSSRGDSALPFSSDVRSRVVRFVSEEEEDGEDGEEEKIQNKEKKKRLLARALASLLAAAPHWTPTQCAALPSAAADVLDAASAVVWARQEEEGKEEDDTALLPLRSLASLAASLALARRWRRRNRLAPLSPAISSAAALAFEGSCSSEVLAALVPLAWLALSSAAGADAEALLSAVAQGIATSGSSPASFPPLPAWTRAALELPALAALSLAPTEKVRRAAEALLAAVASAPAASEEEGESRSQPLPPLSASADATSLAAQHLRGILFSSSSPSSSSSSLLLLRWVRRARRAIEDASKESKRQKTSSPSSSSSSKSLLAEPMLLPSDAEATLSSPPAAALAELGTLLLLPALPRGKKGRGREQREKVHGEAAGALAAAARLQPSSAIDSLPPLLASVARKSRSRNGKGGGRNGARAALAAALAAADAAGTHPGRIPAGSLLSNPPPGRRRGFLLPELAQALGLRLACRAWLSAGARRGAAFDDLKALVLGSLGDDEESCSPPSPPPLLLRAAAASCVLQACLADPRRGFELVQAIELCLRDPHSGVSSLGLRATAALVRGGELSFAGAWAVVRERWPVPPPSSEGTGGQGATAAAVAWAELVACASEIEIPAGEEEDDDDEEESAERAAAATAVAAAAEALREIAFSSSSSSQPDSVRAAALSGLARMPQQLLEAAGAAVPLRSAAEALLREASAEGTAAEAGAETPLSAALSLVAAALSHEHATRKDTISSARAAAASASTAPSREAGKKGSGKSRSDDDDDNASIVAYKLRASLPKKLLLLSSSSSSSSSSSITASSSASLTTLLLWSPPPSTSSSGKSAAATAEARLSAFQAQLLSAADASPAASAAPQVSPASNAGVRRAWASFAERCVGAYGDVASDGLKAPWEVLLRERLVSSSASEGSAVAAGATAAAAAAAASPSPSSSDSSSPCDEAAFVLASILSDLSSPPPLARGAASGLALVVSGAKAEARTAAVAALCAAVDASSSSSSSPPLPGSVVGAAAEACGACAASLMMIAEEKEEGEESARALVAALLRRLACAEGGGAAAGAAAAALGLPPLLPRASLPSASFADPEGDAAASEGLWAGLAHVAGAIPKGKAEQRQAFARALLPVALTAAAAVVALPALALAPGDSSSFEAAAKSLREFLASSDGAVAGAAAAALGALTSAAVASGTPGATRARSDAAAALRSFAASPSSQLSALSSAPSSALSGVAVGLACLLGARGQAPGLGGGCKKKERKEKEEEASVLPPQEARAALRALEELLALAGGGGGGSSSSAPPSLFDRRAFAAVSSAAAAACAAARSRNGVDEEKIASSSSPASAFSTSSSVSLSARGFRPNGCAAALAEALCRDPQPLPPSAVAAAASALACGAPRLPPPVVFGGKSSKSNSASSSSSFCSASSLLVAAGGGWAPHLRRLMTAAAGSSSASAAVAVLAVAAAAAADAPSAELCYEWIRSPSSIPGGGAVKEALWRSLGCIAPHLAPARAVELLSEVGRSGNESAEWQGVVAVLSSSSPSSLGPAVTLAARKAALYLFSKLPEPPRDVAAGTEWTATTWTEREGENEGEENAVWRSALAALAELHPPLLSSLLDEAASSNGSAPIYSSLAFARGVLSLRGALPGKAGTEAASAALLSVAAAASSSSWSSSSSTAALPAALALARDAPPVVAAQTLISLIEAASSESGGSSFEGAALSLAAAAAPLAAALASRAASGLGTVGSFSSSSSSSPPPPSYPAAAAADATLFLGDDAALRLASLPASLATLSACDAAGGGPRNGSSNGWAPAAAAAAALLSALASGARKERRRVEEREPSSPLLNLLPEVADATEIALRANIGIGIGGMTVEGAAAAALRKV